VVRRLQLIVERHSQDQRHLLVLPVTVIQLITLILLLTVNEPLALPTLPILLLLVVELVLALLSAERLLQLQETASGEEETLLRAELLETGE